MDPALVRYHRMTWKRHETACVNVPRRTEFLRVASTNLKNASHRLSRSPSALLKNELPRHAFRDLLAGAKEQPLRPNQGTAGSSGDARSEVGIEIVGLVVLPGTPEHAQPGAGEDADGVTIVASTVASTPVEGRRLSRGMSRVVDETGDGSTQASIAGPSEDHAAAFTALFSDRGATSLLGEGIGGGKTFAHAAKFGGDLRGTDVSGTWERHDDASFRRVRRRHV